MNISKKIAIALECLIDFDEAQDILKDRWYGDTNTDDIPYERWSRTFFAQLPPRKGTMGFVNDMRDEGAQVVFFSNTDDPIQGERAERWLRDWTADAFLILAQTNRPAALDAQVIFVPESSSYDIPAGRLRVCEVPAAGTFNYSDYEWALDLDVDGRKPEPKKATASASKASG